MSGIDVLVLSAHPDDAELAVAGTVKGLTNAGRSVVFVECTRGELGTRGTPELRAAEAQHASEILGVTLRENLGMPDGAVAHTQANILAVVGAIRRHRPRIMLIPPPFERHPDHEAVHRLARAAAFTAGLANVSVEHNGQALAPHRPKAMYCFQQQYDFPQAPSFYVDITATWADKLASIRAYASQFHVPDVYQSDEPQTFISRPGFVEELEARARYYGSRIGTTYAEAYLSVEPLGFASMEVLL